jgi:hypothetical protein
MQNAECRMRAEETADGHGLHGLSRMKGERRAKRKGEGQNPRGDG